MGQNVYGNIEREMADFDTGTQRHSPWEHLAALLPLEDLTHQAQSGAIPPAVPVPRRAAERRPADDDPLGDCTRALYRGRQGHLLLTGRKGVGKTILVRELARRAAGGEMPFLSGRRFVWIDAAGGYRSTSVPKTAGRNLERGIEIARSVVSRLQQPFTRAIEARFREIVVESRRLESVEGVLARVGLSALRTVLKAALLFVVTGRSRHIRCFGTSLVSATWPSTLTLHRSNGLSARDGNSRLAWSRPRSVSSS